MAFMCAAGSLRQPLAPDAKWRIRTRTSNQPAEGVPLRGAASRAPALGLAACKTIASKPQAKKGQRTEDDARYRRPRVRDDEKGS